MRNKNCLPVLILLLALLALFVAPVFAQENDPPPDPVTAPAVTVEAPLDVTGEDPAGIDWNKIIGVAIAAVVVWGFKELRTWWSDWKTKKYWEATALEDVAQIAVRYAEQTGLNKRGEEKLTEAMNYAQAWLASRGIKINLYLLRGMIEAKVNDLTSKQNQG